MGNNFQVAFTGTGSAVQTLTLASIIEDALKRLPHGENSECFMVVQKDGVLRTVNISKRLRAFSHCLALQAINSKPLRDYPRINNLEKLATDYIRACAGWTNKDAFIKRRENEEYKFEKWLWPSPLSPHTQERILIQSLGEIARDCLDFRQEKIIAGIMAFVRLSKDQDASLQLKDINQLFVSVVQDLFGEDSGWWFKNI